MKVWLSFVPIDIIKWYFHIGIGKTLDNLGFWVGCPKKEKSFSFTETNWRSQKFTDITIPLKGFLCLRVFSLVENKGCNLFYHLLNFHPLSLMRQHLHRNPLNLTRISFLSSQILFVLPMTKLSCLSIDKMEPWVHVICTQNAFGWGWIFQPTVWGQRELVFWRRQRRRPTVYL